MTSETDYSIHRAVGAPEIPTLRPPSDREPRRKRRRKKGGTRRDPEQTGEEAVQVELQDAPVDPENGPNEGPDTPPPAPAVDCLA